MKAITFIKYALVIAMFVAYILSLILLAPIDNVIH